MTGGRRFLTIFGAVIMLFAAFLIMVAGSAVGAVGEDSGQFTLAWMVMAASAMAAGYGAFQSPTDSPWAAPFVLGVGIVSGLLLAIVGAHGFFIKLWMFSGLLMAVAGALQMKVRQVVS